MSLLAATGIRGPVLLEDAIDLVDFLEATGRTIPRNHWAQESIQAANDAALEALF